MVGDDKSILSATTKVLEKTGFYADTAETGREAIEKSKVCHYEAC